MQIELEEFIPLVITLLLTGALIGHMFWYKTEYVEVPKVINQTQVVEIPVIIKEYVFVELPVIIKETEIQVIEVPEIITQVETVVQEIEVPVLIRDERAVELINFESKVALKSFLREDETDKIKYTNRFTCMDFTLKIIGNAADAGYQMQFLYWQKPDNTAHAVGMAYVEHESEWVIFEPQNDMILWSWTSTEGG